MSERASCLRNKKRKICRCFGLIMFEIRDTQELKVRVHPGLGRMCWCTGAQTRERSGTAKIDDSGLVFGRARLTVYNQNCSDPTGIYNDAGQLAICSRSFIAQAAAFKSSQFATCAAPREFIGFYRSYKYHLCSV